MDEQELECLLRQHSIALLTLAALVSSILTEEDKERIHANFSAMLQGDLEVSERTRAYFQEEISAEDLEFTLRLIKKVIER